MPNFTFKGRNRQGETVAGERVAEDRGALAIALRREQIMLTDAAEKQAGKFNFDFGGNANAKDLAVFTRQFSVMIDAGVPLVQCLEILGEQQDKKKFQTVIRAVQRDVESGSNLADAMIMLLHHRPLPPPRFFLVEAWNRCCSGHVHRHWP